METALALLGGLVLLILGGELLVRGSVRLAEQLGLSPLLIGLTLVGFGTSTPELATSVQAAMIGSPGIAVGNIVGSNTANILLILGVSALIFPIAVDSRALKRDGMFGLALALLLAGVGWTLGLTRGVGAAFVALLCGYLVLTYLQERRTTADHGAVYDKVEAFESLDPAMRPASPPRRGWIIPLLTALAGLAAILFGARFLVSGAIDLARDLGLAEEVIGLTIVALGTSAPELVASSVAAARRQSELALGNVLGSNIYNILGIGGLTGLIAPTPVPARIAGFDLPVMVAATALLVVFAWTGMRLGRREGGALLALYLAYVGWLVVQAP